MRISLAILSVFFLAPQFAVAAVIVSTNRADFTLTWETFPDTGFDHADIVSDSGKITLDNAQDVGNPATGLHAYTEFSSFLPGAEYVLNGDENFDMVFSTLQLAFAMDYVDHSTDSLFTLTFFNDGFNVGSTSFTSTTPFNTPKFIGFISDAKFNEVEIRENDGTANSDELFQFYTASPAVVPEPSTLAGLLSLGGMGLIGRWLRRRKLSRK